MLGAASDEGMAEANVYTVDRRVTEVDARLPARPSFCMISMSASQVKFGVLISSGMKAD